MVQRAFSLVRSAPSNVSAVQHDPFKGSLLVNAAPTESIQPPNTAELPVTAEESEAEQEKTILKTEYKATTNRMLRVAVNGFFESLGTVVQVMEELDVDVLHEKGLEDLEGAQGVEQGMTDSTG